MAADGDSPPPPRSIVDCHRYFATFPHLQTPQQAAVRNKRGHGVNRVFAEVLLTTTLGWDQII